MSNLAFVGLGEHTIARRPGMSLKAYSLGSCVALCLSHRLKGIYSMAHIVLPDSIAMPSQVEKSPCYFVDTAVPFLINEIMPGIPPAYVASKGLEAKLIGGARVLKNTSSLDIGKRSIDALTLLLKQYKIPIIASDVGGSIARSVTLNSTDGEIIISSPGIRDRRL